MQSHDSSLRGDLDRAAEQTGTLSFSAEHIVDLVRRRRRRRLALRVAAGSAAVLLCSAALATWIGGRQHGGIIMAQTPSSARVYMCGQPLDQTFAVENPSGLTMAISTVRRGADTVGPDITVTFTATSSMFVNSSPPQLFEVLYLRAGIIIGGGPMLNMPGDESRQTLDLVHYGFDVEPGRPSIQDLGRRDKLCPGLSWQQVWSAPQSYEVVVLQGPVTGQPPEISLGIPAPHLPLLVSRSGLAQ